MKSQLSDVELGYSWKFKEDKRECKRSQESRQSYVSVSVVPFLYNGAEAYEVRVDKNMANV